MDEIFDDIERWIESGEKVAIARVVDIEVDRATPVLLWRLMLEAR